MLLRKILVLEEGKAGGDLEFVECAIIREAPDNWTVKPLSAEHFDPQCWHPTNLAMHMAHWRISKKDGSAELMGPEDTFDTATLHRHTRGIIEGHILHDKSEPGSPYHRIREALDELIRIGELNLDQRVNDCPVIYLIEQRKWLGCYNRLEVVAAEILIGGAGGMSDEVRLNNAGFKMYTRVYEEAGETVIRMRLCRLDQGKQYPKFIEAANARLLELGIRLQD